MSMIFGLPNIREHYWDFLIFGFLGMSSIFVLCTDLLVVVVAAVGLTSAAHASCVVCCCSWRRICGLWFVVCGLVRSWFLNGSSAWFGTTR